MGKATLIMVIGLSIVLGMVGLNLNRKSSSAIANAENYYSDAALFSIKTSGANLAVSRVFRDTAFVSAISIGGSTTLYSGDVNMPVAGSGSSQKVGELTVVVQRPLRDSLCVRATSIGKAYDIHGTSVMDTDYTIVGMRRTNFAEYSYFTDFETTPSGSNIWWVSGDSIGINKADTMNGGKIHTNDMLRVDGDPVFFGKVTSKLGKTLDAGSHPVFKGGFESGVTMDMPGDFNLIAQNAPSGFYRNDGRDIWMTFNADGTMSYRYSATGTDSTKALPANGLIVISGAVVHVKGTVKGNVTLASLQGTSSSESDGAIWIDGDVKYSQDPRTNPNSTDMLGIVADNNVWVTNNTANNSDCEIMATIMSRKKSFGAEDYDTRAVSGALRLLGGVIQERRGPVGTTNSSGDINHGFRKVYSYDGRMATKYPPFFPMTKQFKIYTWYE